MTITADFSGGEKTATTEPLYQWDTGQKLALSGLPATSTDIQVHFANAAMAQAIVKATAIENSLPTCDIPNEFLQFGSAAKARAWVFYRTSNTEGYTVRTVLIPVTPRKRPNDYVSPEDPDSKGIVDRAIELLENYQSDLDSKLDDSDGSVKTANLAGESVTVEKVADDLAAVINAKEVKSNKKTALAGNESSDEFYPTTKAVADALNTKAPLSTAYTFDTTTTNVVYNANNPKTIYLNATVDNEKGIVLTSADNYCQYFFGSSKSIKTRTKNGASTYTDWELTAEKAGNKKNSITSANKTSTEFYPSIKAVVDYLVANYPDNKPSINGHELVGNKSSDDLGLQGKLTAGENVTIDANGRISATGGTTDYAQLSNKPTINNVELSGNKTLAALGINAGSVGFDETGTYDDGSIGAVVSNQKKAINDLYDGIHTEIVNWEHGNISQNDGQNANSVQTSRARTIGYIPTDYAITVDRTTIAYEVYIYYYDANKDFVFRTSGYRDSAIAPNKNYAYYRLTILNSSAQNATIDVSRLKTDITFVKKLTFDSQDIYTQVGAFTDKSLFKRNTVGRGAGGIIRFENSQTRIATNPVVRTTAKSYRITPTTGYKYGFYTCSDETHLDPEYSQQAVWRTEENTFKISDNINYVILLIAKTDDSAIYTDDFDKVTVTAEETVQYAINDVYAKIPEAKDDDLLPNYWKEYFNTKETALESADIGLGFNGVSLAFITDIHLGTNNKISPLLLKYITTHTNVRYVVCGGDIVTNVGTKDVALSELNWWMQKTSGLDIVNLHGNHDGNSNNQPDNTQIISDAEFYGLCCRQSENVVNWEHNSLFGYRDNQAQKMRFIYLDTGAPDSAVISNAQIEWMQGKISELPTGWFVLVFCHQFWTGVSKSTSTLSLDVNGTKILNALETIYDTANATICGVIVGHCHRNYSLISAKGFPVIATTCDTSGTGSSKYDPDTPNRTSETTEEQVIDLFYVNTSARTINTIRIGDGDTEQDRSFTF